MKAPATKIATLKVEIPNRTLATALLEKWSTDSGVSLNLLRGRVTAEKAAYEFEIRGSAEKVAAIARQITPWDAARRSLHSVPTGALA